MGNMITSGITKEASKFLSNITTGINNIRLRKLLDPFDIYEFCILLYWFLCFKLDNNNKLLSSETYYNKYLINILSNLELFNKFINKSELNLTNEYKENIQNQLKKTRYITPIVKVVINNIIKNQQFTNEELFELIN